MAIAYLGTGTAAAGSTTPLAVPYPSPVGAGDGMVLLMTGGSASFPTLPGGWTAGVSANSGGSSPYAYIAVKIATGSESGSLSVTMPAFAAKGQILRFGGVDQTTPLDVAGTTYSNSAAATAYDLPTLTTTKAGAALVALGSANASTGTWTNPTAPANSWTKLTDNPTLVPSTYVGYLIWTGSGATGTVNLTRSTSIRGAGGLIALRPADVFEMLTPTPRYY